MPERPSFSERLDNLYFVPIVRNRLNFAVILRSAIAELESLRPLDRQDLIAVALPPSVHPHFEQAIGKFPNVSLILARSGSDHREVFPVSPADGVVEAVRLANERGLQVAYIDREIAPGNLIERRCAADPGWPDDSLLPQLGITKYLDAITLHLSQFPTRIEPVDTWREMFMAESLRALQPLHDRIVIVCDAANARPTMRLLRNPSRHIDENDSALEPPKYSLVTPNLQIYLQYLDDYPRLVERWNSLRWRAPEFDKVQALNDEIEVVVEKPPEENFSFRQYEAFRRFLDNLLTAQRRVCPQPWQLKQACRATFGSGFAQKLEAHLLGYHDLISVLRVETVKIEPSARGALESRANELRVDQTIPDPASYYVGRSCNPNVGGYSVIPPLPRPPAPDPREDSERLYAWPPEVEHTRNMRPRMTEMATRLLDEPGSARFNGSLEHGVDLQRTLRSYLSRKPGIFVKTRKRRTAPTDFALEPTVWLLDLAIDSRVWFGPMDTEKGKIAIIKAIASTESCYESREERVKLIYNRIAGGATFYDARRTLDEIRSSYANNFEARIPDHDKYDHSVSRFSCLDPDVVADAEEGATWWELLLLTALKYARQNVICMCPDGFATPARVRAHPLRANKRVIYIPLCRLTYQDRSKLARSYLFMMPRIPEEGDSADRVIVTRFGKLMKQYWTD